MRPGGSCKYIFNRSNRLFRRSLLFYFLRKGRLRIPGLHLLDLGAEPGPEEAEFPEHVLANGQPMTEANVRAVIEGFRSEYPEGMEWTNDNLVLLSVSF